MSNIYNTVYVDPTGWRVVQVFTAKGNTFKIQKPGGGFLRGPSYRAPSLSFASVETAKKRITKEIKK